MLIISLLTKISIIFALLPLQFSICYIIACAFAIAAVPIFFFRNRTLAFLNFGGNTKAFLSYSKAGLFQLLACW
jgi:hypothetical protein